MQWPTPVIPALRKLKQKDCKFKTSLSYITRPCLKKKIKNKISDFIFKDVLLTLCANTALPTDPQFPKTLEELREWRGLEQGLASGADCRSSRAAQPNLQVESNAWHRRVTFRRQQCRHSTGMDCRKFSSPERDSRTQGWDPFSHFSDSKVPNQFSKSDLLLLFVFY